MIELRQIAASRRPTIVKEKEEKKPAPVGWRIKSVVSSTPLLNAQAPLFFSPLSALSGPITGGGGKTIADTTGERTEFRGYDRRHNRKRHQIVHGVLAFRPLRSPLYRSLFLVRSLIMDKGGDHNKNLFISLDWTKTQVKHTVAVPYQVRSTGI